jgi:hypothetical protein
MILPGEEGIEDKRGKQGEVAMNMTKAREIFAAIAAVAVIVVMAAVGAALAGYRIPVLSIISDALGVGG